MHTVGCKAPEKITQILYDALIRSDLDFVSFFGVVPPDTIYSAWKVSRGGKGELPYSLCIILIWIIWNVYVT